MSASRLINMRLFALTTLYVRLKLIKRQLTRIAFTPKGVELLKSLIKRAALLTRKIKQAGYF